MAKMKEAGHKAHAMKVYVWGEWEIKRAWLMARWTMDNPGKPRSANPYLREKVYAPEWVAGAPQRIAEYRAAERRGETPRQRNTKLQISMFDFAGQ